MTDFKLSYFDFHGGRGEPARLAFYIAGVPFEDNRVKGPQFRELKPSLPYGSLPTLEVDGTIFSQSIAINRYVGLVTGLYPDDALQAAFCDEAMEAVEDVRHAIDPTSAIRDEAAKKAAREALAEGRLGYLLARLAARLAERGGHYFADGRLTVADLSVFMLTRYIQSGILDFIPTDLVARTAPLLVAHHDALKNHPKVVEYYATR